MFRLLIFVIFSFIEVTYTLIGEANLKDKWKIYAFTDVKTCLHYYSKYNPDAIKVKAEVVVKNRTHKLYDKEHRVTHDFEFEDPDSSKKDDSFSNVWQNKYGVKSLEDFGAMNMSRFDYASDEDYDVSLRSESDTSDLDIFKTDAFTKYWKKKLKVKSLDDFRKVNHKKFDFGSKEKAKAQSHDEHSNDEDPTDSDLLKTDAFTKFWQRKLKVRTLDDFKKIKLSKFDYKKPKSSDDSDVADEDLDDDGVDPSWMRSADALQYPESGPHSNTKLKQDDLREDFFSGSQIDKNHPCNFPFGVIGRFQDRGFNETEGFFKKDAFAGDYFRSQKGEMKERHESKTNFAPFLKDMDDSKKKKGYSASSSKESNIIVKVPAKPKQ